MAAIRLIPVKEMAAISVLGCLLIKLLHLYDNTTQSFVMLLALFTAQICIYSFYAIFVYPFFVSPLRHLPKVKGGLPLFGHGIAMRKNGPGVMAKKWYEHLHRPLQALVVGIMANECST
jgi:hypothetical protein